MQQQLHRVDRARREFIATASHELRTPIFSLGGFVELLQDEELDEATRSEFLDTMGEQVARLQKLAVDLLDLSRLDAGSVELRAPSRSTSPSSPARSRGEFRPRLAEHGTRARAGRAGRGAERVCDRERVAQIMRILLDNALRHTPEGTARDRERSPLTTAPPSSRWRTRPRPAGRCARQALRALLHRRRRARRRARPRDRSRAGRAHGRPPRAHSAAGAPAFTLELPAADGNGA